VFGRAQPVTRSSRSSREVAAPCRVFPETLAPLLVRRSPRALCRSRPGFRVFAFQDPEKQLAYSSGSSHGLRLLFRGCPSTEPLHRALGFPPALPSAVKPSAFLQRLPQGSDPFSVFPAQGSGIAGRAFLTQPPAPSGSRNLLALSSAPSLPALFHAGSALGVALQSFAPPAQPYAVPSAVPLLAFSRLQGLAPRESPLLGSTV